MNIHNTPDTANNDGAASQTCLASKPMSKPASKPVNKSMNLGKTTTAPAGATNAKPAVPQLQPQGQAKAWRGPWWKN